MSQSLFAIRQDHLSLLYLIEQNEGVLSEEELEAFQLNQKDFKDKAISYAYIIKKYQAESDMIKNEIDRLSKLKKTADNAAERFKKFLSDAMDQFHYEKIDGDTIKISFRKSSPLELSLELQEAISKHISANVSIVAGEEMEKKEDEEDEEAFKLDESILDYLTVSVSVDKTSLKNAIQKEGVKIDGVTIADKKNLQIR